jgi:FtsH-binding integral membrane protein
MYDRDFTPVQERASDSAILLYRVCFLTVAAVACTALGAAVMWNVTSMGIWIAAVIGTFAMLFVCNAVARRMPLNLVCLAIFAFLEGMTLAPILVRYASLPSGPLVIVQAAVLSIVIFAMVGTLGYTSTRSYAHWMPWLMGGLFALIFAGILMWFITASPAMSWLYSVGGCVLFVAFIFVDFNRIRHNFGSEDYIPATMEVYLDLINLFLFLLRLLSRRD